MKSDAALFDAWQGGDREAGAELFDRHFRAIVRFFRNKAGSGLDDLVQTTFLACLEAAGRFRRDASFRTFLFGIAHNVLCNHYRQRRRHEHVVWSVTSLHDLGVRPSEALAERTEHRMLLEALRGIPLEHQVLLELYYWESMPAPQLAAVLELPEGTIRTRLRRAKQLLAESLERLVPRTLATTTMNLDRWAAEVRSIIDADP